MVNFGDTRLPRRFWAKVLPVQSGCWIWIGALSGNGYGSFGDVAGHVVNVHRHAYLTLVGPVAPGMHLDHLCRERSCCNPDHLEVVTHAENVRRGDAGKHWALRTHCPRGHAYDEKNTRWRSDRINSRDCRACHAEMSREYRRFRAEFFPRLRPLTPEHVDAVNAALESA